MFDLFRKRRRERAIIAGAELAASFEALRLAVPAAAYLFARTLVNARPLLDDETMTLREKIDVIDAETEQLKADGERADAGISILAMRFIQVLLAEEQQDAASSFGYSAAFGDIAKHGESYRDVQPRDRLPPSDTVARTILAKQGRTCVAEVIDTLITECRDKGHDLTEIDEPKQTLLALFDLRDEASSGRLLSRLKDIATILGVNYVPP
jgi:hypothetical protein